MLTFIFPFERFMGVHAIMMYKFTHHSIHLIKFISLHEFSSLLNLNICSRSCATYIADCYVIIEIIAIIAFRPSKKTGLNDNLDTIILIT